MTPIEFWKLVAATGILSAFATAFLSWLREIFAARFRDRNEASYLAMRIAVQLEGYAVTCFDYVISADEHFKQHSGASPKSPPEPLTYPSDANWRVLEVRLADEALSFLNEVSLARHSANFAAVFENNPFEQSREMEELGGRAWRLAVELRERYALPTDSYFHKQA